MYALNISRVNNAFPYPTIALGCDSPLLERLQKPFVDNVILGFPSTVPEKKNKTEKRKQMLTLKARDSLRSQNIALTYGERGKRDEKVERNILT